jgi:N-carbamoyl-L-amino-acid hydrolase
MKINASRLLDRLADLARIGGLAGGGVERLAFSDGDRAGRDWVQSHLERLGVDVRIDAIGNLFGVWNPSGTQEAVMFGSHTDTVGRAGRLDGALGVVGALEVLETLIEADWRPARPLILASFVNEEGVRFMPDMMGSLYHAGSLSLEDARAATDRNGIRVGSELDRLQMAGTDSLDDIRVDAFLELHIEQGPVLEHLPADIGIVTGVQGLSWFRVEVRGASNHAGTTPMELRRDAGAVADALKVRLRELPSRLAPLRLTIGSTDWFPNLVNVIPDRVRFTVDLRHPTEAGLVEAEQAVADILQSGKDTSWHSLARVAPCDFDTRVIEVVEEAAATEDLRANRMISGASHDAHILQRCYRCGMIFIPSRGGISHHPDEYSTDAQLSNGVQTLLGAVMRLAG